MGIETQRTWTLGLLAACASAVAIAPIFTYSQPFCALHDADSVIPTLMSVQKITWYYWGQARVGSLWSVLAYPFPEVSDNMTAQVFLRTVLGLLSFTGIQFFLGPVRHVFVRILLAMLVGGAIFTPSFVFTYVSRQPYGTATTVAAAALLAGCWAWHRSGWRMGLGLVVAFLLAVVAFWVNRGALLLLGPLALGMALVGRRYLLALAMLLAAFAVAWLHASSQPMGGRLGLFVDPDSWARAWQALPIWIHRRRLVAQLLLTAGGLAVLHIRAARAGRRGWLVDDALFRLELLFAVALGHQLFVPMIDWVQYNDFHPRYSLPGYVALSVVSAGVFVELMRGTWAPSRRIVQLAAPGVALCVLVGVWRIAGPLQRECSFIEVRRRADVALLRDRAQRYGANLAGGWYWLGWPTVFHTLDLRQRIGDTRPMYGTSDRAEAMAPEIAALVNSREGTRVVCGGHSARQCALDAGRLAGWSSAEVGWDVLESGALSSGRPFSVLELRRNREVP